MSDPASPVLSFPAILRNPGLKTHLQPLPESMDTLKQPRVTKRLREQREGKRWLRREDNAGFVGNPHIVAAATMDYLIPLPRPQSTFPEPLPDYLPRTMNIPAATLPATDITSANAGRFSVSMKGMRRDLRRAGGKAEWLVRDVEAAIVEWLASGGTLLSPDNNVEDNRQQDSCKPIGSSGVIVEVSRTPLQLIWRIPLDGFARYIVHCCARYYEVVSFSKGANDSRLTYLLRPNVTRPDRRTIAALETPPATDIEVFTNPETDIDSDFVSERDLESDIELSQSLELPPIAEGQIYQDKLSTIADDEEMLDLDSEFGSELEGSIDVLQVQLETLSVHGDGGSFPISSPIESTRHRHRRRLSGIRSPSPSLSPVRVRRRRRAALKKRKVRLSFQETKSFYDYLFL